MFGTPVTYVPLVGAAVPVQSVFRETPITVTGPDGGDVLIEAVTWRVPKTSLMGVVRGDHILLSDGRRFRVLNQIGTGSPATDAFVVYEMELVP